MIEAAGAAWLTQALHAAGTLPADNTVTAMKVTPFVAGSMSLKCFLDVSYAKRSEGDGLHTSLFVKYPFRAIHEHEKKSAFITRCLYATRARSPLRKEPFEPPFEPPCPLPATTFSTHFPAIIRPTG